MHYNFDEVINRQNTNALNTDGFRGYIFHAGPEKKFAFKDDEFIRMWVADMEFATPPEICNALKERIDKKIFGYTGVYKSDYYEAFSGWCQKMYNWTFPQEELVFSAGIIPALYQLVEDLVAPSEKVLITTPAYGFFQHAVEYSNKTLECSPLQLKDGTFAIDFEDFEKQASDPKMKLVIWCNPHNPSGRVWTENELQKIAQIVKKYNLWIISDEIHCDLIRQGYKHIPMGKIMPDYKKLITCMSASKTFNMAGFMFSDIIIRDATTRAWFQQRDKNVGFINPLSIAAHQAAYTHCSDWLDQLKTYLDGNFHYVEQFLTNYLPECKFKTPAATYLAWVDMNAYLGDVEDIPGFFANNAGVLLEGGDSLFVGNANGYIRLNLAAPHAVIEEGMNRIYKAIITHKK